MKSFVSDNFESIVQRLVDRAQDNLFDPIRHKAVGAGQHESGAQQARVEAKSRYVDWMAQKDGASLVRITIFRQDSRRQFDEACKYSSVSLHGP